MIATAIATIGFGAGFIIAPASLWFSVRTIFYSHKRICVTHVCNGFDWHWIAGMVDQAISKQQHSESGIIGVLCNRLWRIFGRIILQVSRDDECDGLVFGRLALTFFSGFCLFALCSAGNQIVCFAGPNAWFTPPTFVSKVYDNYASFKNLRYCKLITSRAPSDFM